MGLQPNIWGPSLWHSIHSICYTFPPEPTADQKAQYNTFFMSLPYILPCPTCRENLVEHLQLLPPPLTNTTDMWRWSVDLHNLVNKQLGKPALTYLQAANAFKKYAPQAQSRKRLFSKR